MAIQTSLKNSIPLSCEHNFKHKIEKHSLIYNFTSKTNVLRGEGNDSTKPIGFLLLFSLSLDAVLQTSQKPSTNFTFSPKFLLFFVNWIVEVLLCLVLLTPPSLFSNACCPHLSYPHQKRDNKWYYPSILRKSVELIMLLSLQPPSATVFKSQ